MDVLVLLGLISWKVRLKLNPRWVMQMLAADLKSYGWALPLLAVWIWLIALYIGLDEH